MERKCVFWQSSCSQGVVARESQRGSAVFKFCFNYRVYTFDRSIRQEYKCLMTFLTERQTCTARRYVSGVKWMSVLC